MKQGKGAINSIPLYPSSPQIINNSQLMKQECKQMKMGSGHGAPYVACQEVGLFFAGDRRSRSGSKNRVTPLNLSFISIYSSLTFFR